jgi:hypothetical protein
MSSEQNPLDIAAQAERDLNSREAKTGASKPSDSGTSPFQCTIPQPRSIRLACQGGKRDVKTQTSYNIRGTANESGVNANVTNKFPGSTVTYGSAASGQGGNREIPESEGGGFNPKTGQ